MAESTEEKKTPEAAAVPAPVETPAAPALDAGAEEPAKARKVRVKAGKLVPSGIVFIQASFNNTIVTITDPRGATVSWSSAGRCGFKGSRKSTAYAATVVAQEAARTAVSNTGMREVEIHVQGPGSGRESAIRAIQSAGMNVTAIKDVTPVPHNGCRAPKRRRV